MACCQLVVFNDPESVRMILTTWTASQHKKGDGHKGMMRTARRPAAPIPAMPLPTNMVVMF